MGCRADSRLNLDTYPLPLTANGLSQVVHLCANDIIDCFAGSVDIFADRIRHVVDGKGIDELFAAIACDAITASGLFTGPACAIAAAVGCPACAW